MHNSRVHTTSRGFTIIEVAIVFVSFIIIGIVGLFAWNSTHPKTTIKLPLVAKSATASTACKTTKDVELCVKRQTDVVQYTGNTPLSVTITNKGAQTYTQSFSSTCTDPYLIYNGKVPIGGACGMAITSVSLAPGEKKEHKLILDGANLAEGKNDVQVGWGEIESDKIAFTRSSVTTADKKQESTCLGRNDQPAYCASINITIKEGYYSDNSSCTDLAKYFESLGAKPQMQYCDLGSIGVIYYIVPKSDKEAWKEKFSAFPQVDSVTTD